MSADEDQEMTEVAAAEEETETPPKAEEEIETPPKAEEEIETPPKAEEVMPVEEAEAVAEQQTEKESNVEEEQPPTKKAKVDDAEEAATPVVEAEKKAEEESEEDKNKRPADLEKFWKTVEDDPSDFTGWTYLLQWVDANGTLAQGEEAYDAFLHRYPYCYGYWKKYADFEKRKGESSEKVKAVFEAGMEAIPLSADLWIHYLNWVRGNVKEGTSNEEEVRMEYERAVQECGREWRSDKLWDHYVKWETNEAKDYQRVMKLYERILANPTQGLSHQYEMFKEFVKEKNPKDVMPDEEFLTLRKEVLDAFKAAEKRPGSAEPAEKKEGEEKSEDKPAEGEEVAPGKESEAEDADRPLNDEENQAMREKIIFSRKKIFKATEDKVQDRWKFEDQIKRPYFHMKPLERGQLKNWNEYLDKEIKRQGKEGGDEREVEILFERCLIACALYEEFWTKYVDWLSNTRKTWPVSEEADKWKKVRKAYKRACMHHMPKKMDIHLDYASFEEKQGEFGRALEILEGISAKHPDVLNIKLRIINLHRRRNEDEKVRELYKDAIKNAKSVQKTELIVKFARYLRLAANDTEAAASLVENAINLDDENPKLYLNMLDIRLNSSPLNVEAVLKVIDQAGAKLGVSNPRMKVMFAQRKVEFLEDFGDDIESLIKAKNELAEATQDARDKAAGLSSRDKKENAPPSATNGGTKTYSAASSASNSASYNAQHNSQYQQYGSRYSGGGGGGGQGGYGQGYYQGYGY